MIRCASMDSDGVPAPAPTATPPERALAVEHSHTKRHPYQAAQVREKRTHTAGRGQPLLTSNLHDLLPRCLATTSVSPRGVGVRRAVAWESRLCIARGAGTEFFRGTAEQSVAYMKKWLAEQDCAEAGPT